MGISRAVSAAWPCMQPARSPRPTPQPPEPESHTAGAWPTCWDSRYPKSRRNRCRPASSSPGALYPHAADLGVAFHDQSGRTGFCHSVRGREHLSAVEGYRNRPLFHQDHQGLQPSVRAAAAVPTVRPSFFQRHRAAAVRVRAYPPVPSSAAPQIQPADAFSASSASRVVFCSWSWRYRRASRVRPSSLLVTRPVSLMTASPLIVSQDGLISVCKRLVEGEDAGNLSRHRAGNHASRFHLRTFFKGNRYAAPLRFQEAPTALPSTATFNSSPSADSASSSGRYIRNVLSPSLP